jgi:hypothetical protein
MKSSLEAFEIKMKHLPLLLAFAVSGLVSAQAVSFTIVNDTYTDMAFFDIFSINPNSGDVTSHCRNKQAFNGIICTTNFKLPENEELVIQRRTYPDRQLLGEYSARVTYTNENTELLVIESSDRFQVIEGMTEVEAIIAGCNQPDH